MTFVLRHALALAVAGGLLGCAETTEPPAPVAAASPAPAAPLPSVAAPAPPPPEEPPPARRASRRPARAPAEPATVAEQARRAFEAATRTQPWREAMAGRGARTAEERCAFAILGAMGNRQGRPRAVAWALDLAEQAEGETETLSAVLDLAQEVREGLENAATEASIEEMREAIGQTSAAMILDAARELGSRCPSAAVAQLLPARPLERPEGDAPAAVAARPAR